MNILRQQNCRSDLKAALAVGLAAFLTACAHGPPGAGPTGQSEPTTIVEPPPPPPKAPESEVDTEIDVLLDALEQVSEHGLDPEIYGLSQLRTLADDPAAQLDAAREAWALAATHLAHGYLDPETLAPRVAAGADERALLKYIEAEGGPRALASALSGLAPQHPPYLALRRELARQRTAMEEDTDPDSEAARSAMIDKLRVNLERWRWLPHDLGRRSVLANIAGFDVTTYEQDTPTTRNNAIFGKTQRQTPNFSDEIEYIVFNPWWEVPDSIARSDKLPQFRRDPGAISRFGYQILDRQGNVVDPSGIDWNSVKAAAFPYRIRQAPRPQNALGQVKIMFPNPYNVYLHDTPEKNLFESDQRTFSSGCIRVQNPLDLAEWVLKETPGWDRAQIDAAVGSDTETRVDLAQPVPVRVVYLTAISNPCGEVSYLDDVYDRDAAVLAALQGSAEK